MKLNANKAKTMIVSRSRQCISSHPLTIDGTVLKESDDLDILGVTFDSKMTFENLLPSVSRAASQRLCILRINSWRVFNDGLLLLSYFQSCVIPVLKYYFQWGGRLRMHTLIKPLFRVVFGACFLSEVRLSVTFHAYLRSVAIFLMLFNNNN